MIKMTPLVFLLTASSAIAHPGHFAEALAGHDHLFAAAALAAAVAAGLCGALNSRAKFRKVDAKDDTPKEA